MDAFATGILGLMTGILLGAGISYFGLRLRRSDEAALANSFNSMAAKALQFNNQSFLDLAKSTLERFQEGARHDLDRRQVAVHELVKPLRESLERVDAKIADLEKVRVGAYAGLRQQIQALLESQTQLRGETANLVKALRSPVTRGRWGEIQLKRVVELAGMVKFCDFFEQVQVLADRGPLRPDMVVKLPGDKSIVVDAKAPLAAYLEAIEAGDEATRISKLKEHSEQVRRHVKLLSEKLYWDQFQPAPEFVIMFLPGETFFSAALEQDPTLIEHGVAQQVIIATPTTLIALLRAVAYGWRQQSLEQNAKEISSLGRDLYKRLSGFGGYIADVGKNLTASVNSYNKAVGTLESRVLVTARRFRDLHAAAESDPLDVLAPLDLTARIPQAVELRSEEV